jgi:hypothetical protein
MAIPAPRTYTVEAVDGYRKASALLLSPDEPAGRRV